MGLLTIPEAAVKLDTQRETIEQWIELGLLAVHPPPVSTSVPAEKWVAEEELFRIAESVGWLHLSQQNWDDIEAV